MVYTVAKVRLRSVLGYPVLMKRTKTLETVFYTLDVVEREVIHLQDVPQVLDQNLTTNW